MLARQPVAYTSKYYEKTLLTSNRFLGLPNALWCAWATLMIGMTGWFASGESLGFFIMGYGFWLLAIALVIWLVFNWLTPGRATIKNAALEEHRIEVQHVAALYGVSTDEVLLAESEAERQLLEFGRVDLLSEGSCPTC